jgi:hypothetical protein
LNQRICKVKHTEGLAGLERDAGKLPILLGQLAHTCSSQHRAQKERSRLPKERRRKMEDGRGRGKREEGEGVSRMFIHLCNATERKHEKENTSERKEAADDNAKICAHSAPELIRK